jgi:hypothetical protein
MAKSGVASSLKEITDANQRLATVGKKMFQKTITDPEKESLKNRF